VDMARMYVGLPFPWWRWERDETNNLY